MTTTSKTSSYAWLVWFIAALFYGIEYFQRVAPGVIAQPLQQSLHTTPYILGLVISFYLYAYAIAQIPVGIILDRFGARIPLTLASGLVALGTGIFASVDALWALALARILVGIGSAFAFVGCLKLANLWFNKRTFPLVVGFTNTIGVLGALFGEAPLSWLIHTVGWRESLMISAIVSLAIAILIALFVRSQPKISPDPRTEMCCSNPDSLIQTLKTILGNLQTWLTALYASLMVVPVIAFAELWAIPFLQDTHHLNKITTSLSVSFIFIGIAVGGPSWGLLSGRIKNRKTLLSIGLLGELLSLCAIIFIHNDTTWLLQLFLFCFGFFTSSMLLCFPINTERHPVHYSATVIAFTNMMIMILGAIFQPLIALILEEIGSSKLISQYSTADFTHAMLILPLVILLNFGILYILKIKK